MRIFKPAYFSKNRKKRENAIAKLSEERCVELFGQDLYTFSDSEFERRCFRFELLNRMSEKTRIDLLEDDLRATELFEYDKNDLKRSILRDIRNTDKLDELYSRTKSAQLREVLIDYIRDPDLLKRIALDSSGIRTDHERITALGKCASDEVAAAIIADASAEGVLLENAMNHFIFRSEIDPQVLKSIAIRWLSGAKVRDELLKVVKEYLYSFEGQQLVHDRIEEHPEESYRLFRSATKWTLLRLLQDSDQPNVLSEVFMGLRQQGISSEELHARIRETMDERRRYLLEDALSSVRNNKDIPYFEAMLDTPRRQEALKYLACYYPNPENFYAKYGDINDVNDCIQELRSMGERRMQDKPASILRAMYRAGKFVEEIKKINGKRISAHADFNTLCGNEHRDFATNWIFKL